jgi:periplasmic divalent cation tolerance protein
MDSPARTVLVTVPDSATGEALGRTLVEERLAACANIVPGIVSVYRWEGTIQRDSEALMILKTTVAAMEALRERIVTLHPYDVPEVLALPVVDGHGPYLRWVEDEVEVGDGSA